MGERPDLTNILHSPLDEPDPPVQWLPLIGGILAGGLVVIGAYLAASGNSDHAAPGETTSPTAATTTTGVVDTDDVAFPPGFEPLTDVVGGKPVYAIEVDDELVVSIATAARRGVEADGSFGGGEWALETAAGETVASSGVVFDAFLDGVFSVVFPAPDESGLRTLRLVERWSGDVRSGSATLEPVTLPGTVAGDVVVDLGGGVALRLSQLAVTEGGASLLWELTGADAASQVNVTLRAVQGGDDLAFYFSVGSGPFFSARQRLERFTSGRIEMQREQGLEGEIAEATALVFDVDATLVVAVAGSAEWDVADLPIVVP